MKNLIGKRFGKLVVTALAEPKNGRTCWVCQCDCGNVTSVFGGNLKRTKGCGCERNVRGAAPIGKRFGSLTVLGEDCSAEASTSVRIKKLVCKNKIVLLFAQVNPSRISRADFLRLRLGKIHDCRNHVSPHIHTG